MRSVFFIFILIVLIVGGMTGFNTYVYCTAPNTTETLFSALRLSCNTIPDKKTELALVLNRTCEELRTTYNCDVRNIEKPMAEYTELGQNEKKNYTFLQLCRISNPYYIPEQCAQTCGCKIIP